MVRVALQARVRHPAHVLALLKVPCEAQRVARVPLRPQAERLDAEKQLLGGEGVEGGAQVAQGLDAGSDDEGDGAKGLPEL